MDQLDTRIPLSYDFGSSLGDQIKSAVNLANMLDDRDAFKQKLKQEQINKYNRQRVTDIYQQNLDEGGFLTPEGYQQISAIDNAMAQNIGKAEGERKSSDIQAKEHFGRYKGAMLDLASKQNEILTDAYSNVQNQNDLLVANKTLSLAGIPQAELVWQYSPEAVGTVVKNGATIKEKIDAAKNTFKEEMELRKQAEEERHNRAMEAKPSSGWMNYGFKQDQWGASRRNLLADALDPSKGVRSQFAVPFATLQRAESVEALVKRFPSGNLNHQEMVDLATGLYGLISRSNVPSERMVKEIMPKSVMGDAMKFTQWLTNNPRGSNQQKFVERMAMTVEAEKKLSENQVKRIQFKRIAPFKDVEVGEPEEFDNILSSYGVDPEEFRAWKAAGKPKINVQPTFNEKGEMTNPGGDWKPEEATQSGISDLDALDKLFPKK